MGGVDSATWMSFSRQARSLDVFVLPGDWAEKGKIEPRLVSRDPLFLFNIRRDAVRFDSKKKRFPLVWWKRVFGPLCYASILLWQRRVYLVPDLRLRLKLTLLFIRYRAWGIQYRARMSLKRVKSNY